MSPSGVIIHSCNGATLRGFCLAEQQIAYGRALSGSVNRPYFNGIGPDMNFNEKEVGKLIQRATELHEQSIGNSDQNLSLSEIESIAVELGVPVRFLREAALEVKEGHSAQDSFSFWGAPFTVDQTRLANGKLSDKDWDEVLLELQRFSGKSGTAGSTGQARYWTHQIGEGDAGFNFEKLKVTVQPSGEDQTAIHIRQDFQGAVAMYAMAFGITSFFTLMVAHSLPDVAKFMELLYAGLGGVASLGGVRALVAASTKRYKEKLSGLADHLRQIIDKPTDVAQDDRIASGQIAFPEQDEYASNADHQNDKTRAGNRQSGKE